MSLRWVAMAPQATTPNRSVVGVGGVAASSVVDREGELVDEAVVEVGAVGEFDVLHLLE